MPNRYHVSDLSPNQVYSNLFYYHLSFDYFNETFAYRDFILKLSFTHSAYHELGLIAYLEFRNLSILSNTLSSYCLRLGREFYANLFSFVLDENFLWYQKVYMRDKFISISPIVICDLLGHSHHDLNDNATHLLKVCQNHFYWEGEYAL